MAQGKTTANEPLRYPLNRVELENSDFLKIMVLSYEPPGTDVFTGFNIPSAASRIGYNQFDPSFLNQKTKILETILLPIPQSIQDSNGVRWGEDRLNPIAARGLSGITQTLSAENLPGLINTAKENAFKLGADLANEGKNLSNLFFGSQIVNALGGNTSFQGLVSRTTGQVLNPNLELLFNGVTLRSFSFDFDLVPREERESRVVRKIIRTLKQNMSAKGGSSGDYSKGLFIKSPNIFQLVYSTGTETHRYLNRFKPMALKNMSVNYTGSGTYATYTDTSPVHYKLNLQFQELDPIYAEDYGADPERKPSENPELQALNEDYYGVGF
jgi:hypothetical protein|tara:strand:- start:33 stop:1013 length:981 start_codon:yes stop_codon:yes gene_type:complete